MYTFDRRKVYMWFFLRFAPESQSAQRKRRTQRSLHTSRPPPHLPRKGKASPRPIAFPFANDRWFPRWEGEKTPNKVRVGQSPPDLPFQGAELQGEASVFKGRNCKEESPLS